jgi:hypothetical protein
MYEPGVYFSTSTGYVARWNPADTSLEIIANTGLYLTDIAFDPRSGLLYGITFRAPLLIQNHQMGPQ